MAINFEAEHMQGYNNPLIEIINAVLDGEGNITNITYNDIVKILSRGVFPIVSLHLTASDKYFLLPSSIEDTRIVFSCPDIYGDPATPTSTIVGVTFSPSSPPAMLLKVIS